MTTSPQSPGPASSASGVFAVLPLRDIVVFPHMIVPLFVGREKSIRALEDVMGADKQILLATQKNAADDDPAGDAIYEVGTLASVLQLLKLPDGTVKVLVEGTARAQITGFTAREEFHEAEAAVLVEPQEEEVEIEALSRSVVADFENYVKLNKKISPEVVGAASQIDDYSKLADTVASHLAVKIADKQEMLATLSVKDRLEKAMGFMEAEISVLQVEKRIRSRVKRQMEKTQREYYLNEQMKAIQKELGEGEDGRDEASEIEERIKKTRLSKEAREKAEGELKKLRAMSPMSAEATVVRNYLDWLLSIPWQKQSKVKKDLDFAQEVLDADHFGLDKVKERIVEYLAVQSRTGKLKGPILCLVGPPGVGKTSLARSIAKATGREFIRFAREMGLVMDREMIAKAEEVDKKFNIIASTIGTRIKMSIVDAVSAWFEFLDSYRDFENQANRTLSNRAVEIDKERLRLENEILRIRGEQADITDTAKGMGFGIDSAAVKHEIAEIQADLDRLTAEGARIETVLETRRVDTSSGSGTKTYEAGDNSAEFQRAYREQLALTNRERQVATELERILADASSQGIRITREQAAALAEEKVARDERDAAARKGAAESDKAARRTDTERQAVLRLIAEMEEEQND